MNPMKGLLKKTRRLQDKIGEVSGGWSFTEAMMNGRKRKQVSGCVSGVFSTVRLQVHSLTNSVLL